MPRISDVLANNRSATQMPGMTGAEAVRTPTFWRLAINLFLVGAAMGVAIAPIAHSSPTAGVSSDTDTVGGILPSVCRDRDAARRNRSRGKGIRSLSCCLAIGHAILRGDLTYP
jgi:hypothetical protein